MLEDIDRSPVSTATVDLSNGMDDNNHGQSNVDDLSMKALENIVQHLEFLFQGKKLPQLLTVIKTAPQIELELQNCKGEQEQLKATLQRNLAIYSEDRDEWKTEVSQLKSEIESLRDTVQQKDEAIKSLETSKTKQLETSSKRLEHIVASHKLEAVEMEKKATILQTKLADQGQKFGALTTQLKDKKSEITELNMKLQNQGQTLFDVQKSAGKLQKELDDAAKLKVELWDDDFTTDMTHHLDDVWKETSSLVSEFFGGKWPMDNVKNLAKFLSRLQSSESWAKFIPLPQKDSPAARRMQCVTVMAYIARVFAKRLFHPTLLFGEHHSIREALARQAKVNRAQEAAFRATLLALMPEEQQDAALNQIHEACQEIMKSVGACVPVANEAKFGKRLNEMANKVHRAWQDISRHEYFFEARFDEDHRWDLPWHEMVFVDGKPEIKPQLNKAGTTQEKTMLVIYPRLYWIDERGDEPEQTGVLLMESQVKEAKEELDQLQAIVLQRRDSARAVPTRSRKPSVASATSTGMPNFLESTGSDSSKS